MRLDDLFPSRYLKASDLQGREVPVTISHVVAEEMEGKNGKETKGVLYFRGKGKAMVLNLVNGNTIGDAYGDDLDTWVNCPIILYPDRTQFGGRMVDCIRVRIPQASTPPATPQETPIAGNSDAAVGDDEVPF